MLERRLPGHQGKGWQHCHQVPSPPDSGDSHSGPAVSGKSLAPPVLVRTAQGERLQPGRAAGLVNQRLPPKSPTPLPPYLQGRFLPQGVEPDKGRTNLFPKKSDPVLERRKLRP